MKRVRKMGLVFVFSKVETSFCCSCCCVVVTQQQQHEQAVRRDEVEVCDSLVMCSDEETPEVQLPKASSIAVKKQDEEDRGKKKKDKKRGKSGDEEKRPRAAKRMQNTGWTAVGGENDFEEGRESTIEVLTSRSTISRSARLTV